LIATLSAPYLATATGLQDGGAWMVVGVSDAGRGMDVSNPILVDAEIRFADGRRYWAASDSLSEFILHPVFLKYAAVCVLIYGLLDRGGADTGSLQGFEIVVLWVTLGCVAIGWYALFFILVRALMRREIIKVIYTPVATLSLFMVTTALTYLIVSAFKGHVELSVAEWSKEIIRDMIVILLMDIVFSQFVAPFHPFLLQQPPSQRLASAAPVAPPTASAGAESPVAFVSADPLPQPAPPEAMEPVLTIRPSSLSADVEQSTIDPLRIGNEVFAVEDLIFIQSEDHYLRIVTARRRMLVRGKLADAITQLDFRHGIQINRSTWIAFAAIEDVQDDAKAGTVVTLRGGETERVALSRRIAFLTALRQRGPLPGQVN
jgi:hypothetical protein